MEEAPAKRHAGAGVTRQRLEDALLGFFDKLDQTEVTLRGRYQTHKSVNKHSTHPIQLAGSFLKIHIKMIDTRLFTFLLEKRIIKKFILFMDGLN